MSQPQNQQPNRRIQKQLPAASGRRRNGIFMIGKDAQRLADHLKKGIVETTSVDDSKQIEASLQSSNNIPDQ